MPSFINLALLKSLKLGRNNAISNRLTLQTQGVTRAEQKETELHLLPALASPLSDEPASPPSVEKQRQLLETQIQSLTDGLSHPLEYKKE